jgi:hypothetical protein
MAIVEEESLEAARIKAVELVERVLRFLTEAQEYLDQATKPEPPGFCTCRWSLVNSATLCPPHIIKIDPDCPQHGHEAPPEPDPDEAYERKRDDARFFSQWEDGD